MKLTKVVSLVVASALLVVSFSLAFAGKEDKFISFNTAPASEFLKIQIVDVPEDVANAIVAYREKNGPYKTPEDLLKVPGMTQELWDTLEPIEEAGDIVFEKRGGPGGMNAY